MRQWEKSLPRRVAATLAENFPRPSNLVLPVPGRPQELPRLLSAAERVLAIWGYRLDRTESPNKGTRGVQVYAIFVRRGEVEEEPTTG